MKMLITLMPISSLFALILLLPGIGLAEEDLVAKVGTVPVTRYELQREIDQLAPYRVAFHGGISREKMAEIEQEAFSKLIERGYKICYAQNHQISVPTKRIDHAIQDIKSKFKTAPEFDRAVANETLAGLRASIYRAMLALKAEEIAVEEKLSVTDAQLEEYYRRHLQAYYRPEQFRASHILIKVDPSLAPGEKAVLKEKASGLLARLNGGEEFYQLAYYNSDDRTKYVGGDLGFFHAGQTVPEFEAALAGLEIGQHSNLVETRFGFHIIKLTELNPARQLEFDEVADKIRQQLTKQQRDELYRNWLAPLESQCKVAKISS